MFRRMYNSLHYYAVFQRLRNSYCESVADLLYYFKYRGRYNVRLTITPAWKKIRINFRQDVNLVFFCGIGDALYGLPVLWEIKSRCEKNGRKFNAFFSTIQSNANSQHLGDTLKRLRVFDGVYAYVGLDVQYWKYYQYRHALEVAERFGVKGRFYPYIYKTNSSLSLRTEAVAAQFGMKKIGPLRLPETIHLTQESEQLLSSIQRKCQRANQYVYLCHFDTRSGRYRYEHSAEIISYLLEQGHIVLSPKTTVSKAECPDSDNLFILDNSIDLISLGHILRKTKAKVIAINSVFWPLSHMFELDTLGLHYLLNDDFGYHFKHQKMWLLTPNINVFKKTEKSILVRPEVDYVQNRDNHFMIDFKPSLIYSMLKILTPKTKD